MRKGRGHHGPRTVSCVLVETSWFPQAALAVWSIILRFMGDLPEPVLLARNGLRGSSMMQHLHDTPGGENSTRSPQQRGSTQVPGVRGAGQGRPEVSPRPEAPQKLDPTAGQP